MEKFSENLELIFDEIEDYAIFQIDNIGNIITWHKSGERLTGFCETDVLSKPLSAFYELAGDSPKSIVVEIQSAQNKGKSKSTGWVTSKSTKKIWCSIAIAVMSNKSSESEIFLVTLWDLTEQLIANEKLTLVNIEMEQRCLEKTDSIVRNENRYRSLLENNHDFITLKDAKGRVIYQSPSIERAIGYTIEETNGKPGIDFFHPDDIADVTTRMELALNNPGKPIWGRNRLKHKMGHYIWVEGTTTNLLHDDAVNGIVGNFRDVTERILVETAMNKSREELKNSYKEIETLLNHIDEIFISLDGNLDVTSFNKNAQKHTNKYIKTDIRKGRSIFEIIAPELVDTFRAILNKALGGSKEEIEVEYFDDFGNKEYFFNTIKPTVNADGIIEGVFITKRNVTENVNYRYQLEFDKSNLDALINNTKDLMWSLDLNGHIITSNKSFDERVKLLTGQSSLDANDPGRGFDDGTKKRWDDFYKRAFSGETFTVLEHLDTAEPSWTENSFYPIYNGNEIVGTACYSHDVTEGKLAEIKLKMIIPLHTHSSYMKQPLQVTYQK